MSDELSREERISALMGVIYDAVRNLRQELDDLWEDL